MVVKWDRDARRRLREIFFYYSDIADRRTASKIASGIEASVNSLGMMPFMAPIKLSLEDEPEGYRSLVISQRYKAVYYIEDETVIVADIWDCRQDPETLRERVAETMEI